LSYADDPQRDRLRAAHSRRARSEVCFHPKPWGRDGRRASMDNHHGLGGYALDGGNTIHRCGAAFITLWDGAHNWAERMAVGQRELPAVSVERTHRNARWQSCGGLWAGFCGKRQGASGTCWTELRARLIAILEMDAAASGACWPDFDLGCKVPRTYARWHCRYAAPRRHTVEGGSEWALARPLLHAGRRGLFALVLSSPRRIGSGGA